MFPYLVNEQKELPELGQVEVIQRKMERNLPLFADILHPSASERQAGWVSLTAICLIGWVNVHILFFCVVLGLWRVFLVGLGFFFQCIQRTVLNSIWLSQPIWAQWEECPSCHLKDSPPPTPFRNLPKTASETGVSLQEQWVKMNIVGGTNCDGLFLPPVSRYLNPAPHLSTHCISIFSGTAT